MGSAFVPACVTDNPCLCKWPNTGRNHNSHTVTCCHPCQPILLLGRAASESGLSESWCRRCYHPPNKELELPPPNRMWNLLAQARGFNAGKRSCLVTGPTLLFERYTAADQVGRRFYACSACRDRRECNFFQHADASVSQASKIAREEHNKSHQPKLTHNQFYHRCERKKILRCTHRLSAPSSGLVKGDILASLFAEKDCVSQCGAQHPCLFSRYFTVPRSGAEQSALSTLSTIDFHAQLADDLMLYCTSSDFYS